MRAVLIVLDSFGIGEMPDADRYGDVGSDTYGHIFEKTGVQLKNLVGMGLNNIEGVKNKAFPNGRVLLPVQKPRGTCARLAEKTPAKDTTAGHYEIAGLVLQHPFRVFPTFPPDIVKDLEKSSGTKFLGNEIASGTEIIQRLGPEHLKTGFPILYTSQDSVMQIAADTSVVPLERLYEICEKARALMVGDRSVGRVDMLYGHRNDVKGYAAALKYFDDQLPKIVEELQKDDVLIVTADHGCDPSTPSTDHSREYTPLLIYGDKINPVDLGTLIGFDHIADFVETLFGLKSGGTIYDKVIREV